MCEVKRGGPPLCYRKVGMRAGDEEERKHRTSDGRG